MYKSLVSNTLHRAFAIPSWVFWDDGFSSEELDLINAYCKEKETEKAKTIGDDIKPSDKVRVSDISFHNPTSENQWIFERIFAITSQVNEQYFNFNLNGCNFFQYTEYAGEGSKYDWHIDTVLGEKTLDTGQFEMRKLSLTMCLNQTGIDFKGGDLEIITHGLDEPSVVEQKAGRIFFFPSFLLHRVTPVEFGTRKSIVMWFTGPKFT
jgi:PKHD-type hydroxylase